MAIKINVPPRMGIATKNSKAMDTLIVMVMIQERTIITGALANIRIVIIYAIWTLVISVVIRVTRLGVEK